VNASSAGERSIAWLAGSLGRREKESRERGWISLSRGGGARSVRDEGSSREGPEGRKERLIICLTRRATPQGSDEHEGRIYDLGDVGVLNCREVYLGEQRLPSKGGKLCERRKSSVTFDGRGCFERGLMRRSVVEGGGQHQEVQCVQLPYGSRARSEGDVQIFVHRSGRDFVIEKKRSGDTKDLRRGFRNSGKGGVDLYYFGRGRSSWSSPPKGRNGAFLSP